MKPVSYICSLKNARIVIVLLTPQAKCKPIKTRVNYGTSILSKNARLIDSVSDQPRDGVSFIVDGERITAVESGTISAPPSADVVDLKGQTVLPGLIDTHVHTTLMDKECLPLFLAAGVTTARDVGGKLEKVLQLRADLNSGRQLGPRLFVLGPLLDGRDESFSGSFGEILDSVPSVDAVPQKIGDLLKAGVDGVKLYFTMPPDTAKAIISFVDKRVPVTGHLGYTHSLDVIRAGIDGLEHVWISPYNEFCALNMQFGAGASMMDPNFWIQLTKGWQEADLQGEGARTWFGAMVEKQVNMGTTLDLLWISKFGSEAAQRDPDRRFVPPMALARQREMAAHMGERPDWDIHPGVFDPSRGAKALEKHQAVTCILHEGGGLVVGGLIVARCRTRRPGLPCCAKSNYWLKRSERWPRSRPSPQSLPAICASRRISGASRRGVTPTSWS